MKQHFCPAEQSMIAFEKECNWCGEQETSMIEEGYYCVICGRFLLADEHGVILHDDIEHPPEMNFDDEEKPQ
jgi:hypothetical protein